VGTDPSRATARAAAFAVVRRVFEQGAYADRALHGEAAALDPRERALATALAYGTIQRRATLDHVASSLSSRKLERLDPPVLAALRLGLFQLLFLTGIPEHAAVNESVALVKSTHRSAAPLVNAVLRRAAREGPALLAPLRDDTPAAAAVKHSVPRWLAEQWWAELGADEARALLAHVNEPAESAVRVNELVATRGEVMSRLPVAAAPARDLPEGLVLGGPFDAHGSALFAEGAIMPQSRGSMLVARALAPQPGERVLDLCAAPGAKATHLAALIGDRGEVVAVERHPGRAAALERTAQRMHARSIRVQRADASEHRGDERFDRVLVDPPCSGLGTLQSRPDLRWRVTPDSIRDLAALQLRILTAAAASTALGGTLVYSVCTISRAESESVIEAFLGSHPDFAASAPNRQLLPHRDGTDGFFIAQLHRRPR
jgi:16S rRNA (cytosine967-C5)-methyltransferase